jgi:hypothetical protein
VKLYLLIASIFLGSASFANSKLAEPFTVGVVGRSCVKGVCKNYGQFQIVQVEMQEESGKAGSFSGEAIYQYDVEGVKLSSIVQVSEFEFEGSHQINLYMKTSEDGSSVDLGSSEIIVNKMAALNSVAQYSAAITHGDIKIEPTIIVGPSEASVMAKAATLKK